SAFGLKNADTDVRRMFVPCYLIRHPRGDLLWDAGLDPAIAGQGVVDGGGFTMTYARSLFDQMDDMGLSPDDVDFMALSHMHFDHVGAATQFPKARLLIQAAEYEAAFLRPGDYGGVYDLAWYGDLAGNPRQLLTGDHDLFGDGSVIIVSTPGHTPGHQALLVHLRNTGPVLLSGDLYHFRATRRLRAVPTFNSDADQTLASMVKVEGLIEETGAALWIEHDRALSQTLELAPAAYD
ncbi:MAG: N-acyl homoserine lactonase family protein, partial [Gammaproteobacteria bacterium]|nr:N-acyl homoserine lactonase family protein [Gammaproteobacteria bacterium]